MKLKILRLFSLLIFLLIGLAITIRQPEAISQAPKIRKEIKATPISLPPNINVQHIAENVADTISQISKPGPVKVKKEPNYKAMYLSTQKLLKEFREGYIAALQADTAEEPVPPAIILRDTGFIKIIVDKKGKEISRDTVFKQQ